MTTASSWLLSPALQNPHHADDAYVSREIMWARLTLQRASPHNPWARRVRRAYIVWADLVPRCLTCARHWQRYLCKVTPKTFNSNTRLIELISAIRFMVARKPGPPDNHVVWFWVVEDKVVLRCPVNWCPWVQCQWLLRWKVVLLDQYRRRIWE